MSLQMKVIITSSLSPLIVLAIHMVTARTSRNSSRQKVALQAILTGYIPLFLLLFLSSYRNLPGNYAATVLAVFYCFTVYSCLSYTYFHFFNMSETSRRIRILHEIYSRNRMPLEDITRLYKTSDVVHLRFKRLVELKQIKYDRGLYSIDGRILYFAAFIVSSWRSLLKFPNQGGNVMRET